MDYKTKWKYRQTINGALRGTNYDILNFFILVLLLSIPLGLIAYREMPGMVLGFILLPLPALYFMTFYRWHSENKRRMQGFGSSTSVTVGDGMLDIDDGKAHANLPLENIRELAVFVPEKGEGSSYWWIVVLKGLEYLIPKETEGLENLLREFRDDPVFDTDPVDREDVKAGRWTIWEKEGAG
jgi:hypothetical protein